MPLSEFDLINRYFAHHGVTRPDVVLGISDDGAVLRVPPGSDLVVAMDTMVSDVHFFPDADPASIGHKALAVNLSDMAAMGAEPAWATLALTLPQSDEAWLAAFSAGLFALAGRCGVQLVGGDTCRGPLTLTVQMHGFVPEGMALRRAGARPGDVIYVTGTLGDAALALRMRSGNTEELAHTHAAFLAERLERPTPRIQAGMALRGIASAAIDISDGLTADLGHILKASGVGATLEVEHVPVSTAFTAMAKHKERWNLPLSGGDDYELCFTVPPEKQAEAEQLLARFPGGCTRIGVIESPHGLRCLLNGEVFEPTASGYQHFSA